MTLWGTVKVDRWVVVEVVVTLWETVKVDKRVAVIVEVAVMLGATNNPGLLNRDERNVQKNRRERAHTWQ